MCAITAQMVQQNKNKNYNFYYKEEEWKRKKIVMLSRVGSNFK